MIVKAKFKILSSGFFPMKEFSQDGFIFETEQIDENKLENVNDDDIFYNSNDLIKCSYSVVEKNGVFVDFFKSESYHEFKITNKCIKDEQLLEEEVITKSEEIVNEFEKKLRLITNQYVIFPIYTIKLFKQNDEQLFFGGTMKACGYIKNVREFSEIEKAQQCERLRFGFDDKFFNEVLNKHTRFKRAIHFFNESFSIGNKSVRFVLLMSAFESLFNLHKDEDISETIATYTSKIMFKNNKNENKVYKTMKKLYDERSLYIHGGKSGRITDELELCLREYLREVLIIYWYLSYFYQFDNACKVRDFLDSGQKIDLQVQMFIEALRMGEYKDFYDRVYNNLKNAKLDIVEKYCD